MLQNLANMFLCAVTDPNRIQNICKIHQERVQKLFSELCRKEF